MPSHSISRSKCNVGVHTAGMTNDLRFRGSHPGTDMDDYRPNKALLLAVQRHQYRGYEHCSSIVSEILRCNRADPTQDVSVMAEDVVRAYRNACTLSECVHMFTGHIPKDAAIIRYLSAAFGWTGSVGIASVLGGVVAFIHVNTTDAAHPSGFYNYHWEATT